MQVHCEYSFCRHFEKFSGESESFCINEKTPFFIIESKSVNYFARIHFCKNCKYRCTEFDFINCTDTM